MPSTDQLAQSQSTGFNLSGFISDISGAVSNIVGSIRQPTQVSGGAATTNSVISSGGILAGGTLTLVLIGLIVYLIFFRK